MELKNIAVIGAGTMGSGIAQVAATAGFPVVLRDLDGSILQGALEAIRRSQARIIKAGKQTPEQAEAALGRIRSTFSLEDACADADLVIEAVPEVLKLKQQVFGEMDGLCPAHTILASNTSQLSITSIASATRRPDKVIGMHWFNPPVMMRLIEVVRGLDTSDETLQTVLDLSQKLGKETVVCRDSQGFIVTRALAAFRIECLRMLEEGVATKEDIDKAVRLGLNHPMGPFELADFNGLDVCYHNSVSLAEVYGDRFRPPQMLRQLVDAGYLGRKTGRGFYTYPQAR